MRIQCSKSVYIRKTLKQQKGRLQYFFPQKIALFEKKNLPILVNYLFILIKIYMNNDYAKREHMILCWNKMVAQDPSLVLNILSCTQQWYLSLWNEMY